MGIERKSVSPRSFKAPLMTTETLEEFVSIPRDILRQAAQEVGVTTPRLFAMIDAANKVLTGAHLPVSIYRPFTNKSGEKVLTLEGILRDDRDEVTEVEKAILEEERKRFVGDLLSS